MTVESKLVSIVVPCFNQGQYLNETLESVLLQSYTNWECIIVNDGGTDNTDFIANEWVKRDGRFKYYYKKNSGLPSTRNFGIELAKGEFILPLDSDDKISSNYMQLAIEAFTTDNSLKIVYCKARKFGYVNETWELKSFSLYNLSTANIIFCSAFFRKSDWERVGGYDVNMIYGLEDWEFWISILKNGGNVKCLEVVGFYYRIKENSMVTNIDNDKRNHLFNYLSLKHTEFFVKHLGSFNHLNNIGKKEKQKYEIKMKSKKFAIDVFCKNFFGFSIFKTI